MTATGAPEAISSGNPDRGVFGGISIEISNSSATSQSLSIGSLPAIAEVYTATWCENCVPAEEGLMAAIEESGQTTTVLAFHRAKAETEDPFGVESADERWEVRYGDASASAVAIMRAPPTMVINGELMHAGSGGLEGESLKPIYADSLAKAPRFSDQQGSSTLTWTPGDDGSGSVDWSLEAGDWLPEETQSILFVVEHSATFSEGSNGLGDYHDVVREMVVLDGMSGQVSLTPPEAWDGDDLSLVLVHQWQMPSDGVENDSEDEGILGLPATTAVALSLTLVAAAVISRRRM